MNEKIQSDMTLTSGKSIYEKPTMQVYEIEVEGAILQASLQTMEYESPWE